MEEGGSVRGMALGPLEVDGEADDSVCEMEGVDVLATFSDGVSTDGVAPFCSAPSLANIGSDTDGRPSCVSATLADESSLDEPGLARNS